MQWRNTADQYGFVGKLLHWFIAVAIVAQYLLAEAAEDAEGTKIEPFSAGGLHTTIGITILILALLRVAWRLIELPPERPPAMKRYEIAIARMAHIAFYVLLFAIPLSGWALATASAEGLSFFGWFDLPPVRYGALTKDQLEELHEVLFNVLVGLAVLHIAAALKHQFIDRDNVLRSMLPWRRRGDAPNA